MQEFSVNPKTMIKARLSFAYHLEVVVQILRPLMGPALALAAVVLGASAGMLATKLPLTAVLMMLGGAAVVLVALSRPEFVILLMLAISSTIIPKNSIPAISMGFNFTAIEMCLMFLLGLVVARALSNKRENGFVRTPLDRPLFLFFITSTLSFFNAIYNLGTHRALHVPIWRVFFDYMVFFAVTNLVRTRRQLMTLVGSMLVMATIIAALMIAQQAVGLSVNIIPGQERVGTAAALGQDFDNVARVSIKGAAMVYVMLLPTFILHGTPKYREAHKWLSLIPIMLLPVAIAFTFDRNMWIGAALGGVVFVIIARSESKNFISLILVLAIVASLLVPLLNTYVPRVGSIVDALYLRLHSLFAGDELVYDGSTQSRLRENEAAIAKIKEYPLLGIGPGGVYRNPWWSGDVLTRYMHNAYLYLLVDVGIVGFLPFLWFSIVYLARGFSSWYTLEDRVLKSLVMGFTLSYIAVLSSSMTSPRLLEVTFVPLIGVMLGINEVAIRLDQQSCR